jgi:hypothetical protein
MNLQDRLNYLLGGVVTNFHYDIIGHNISFSVEISEGSNHTKNDILLEEVSLFFFEDPKAQLFSNFKWDKIELSSFDYSLPQAIKVLNSDNHSITIESNVYIELWDSNLFVKANKLKIDQNLFIL